MFVCLLVSFPIVHLHLICSILGSSIVPLLLSVVKENGLPSLFNYKYWMT